MENETPQQESFDVTPFFAFKTFLKRPQGKVAIAFIVLAAFGVLTGQIYTRPVTDDLVRKVTSVIPYPALRVNGESVTIKEFLAEHDALKTYFENAGEEIPSASQLEVAIADTLINKIAIQQLAEQYKITLDEARAQQYYQDIIAQNSEEEFAKDIAEKFGWTTDEFKKRIVDSIVLALQMTDAVLAHTQTQQPRRDLIDGAYARVQGGEDFATVAKDIHAGFQGIEGDLGYVKSSAIPASWADQVNALEVGQMTQVIDLAQGFAVFKIEEKIAAGDDTQLHLLSITVPKVSLEEVVDEYLTTVEVKRYVGKE